MPVLDLCSRMAIVGTIIRPEEVPILEPFDASTGDVYLTGNQQLVELHIPDLNPPVTGSDVIIEVTARIAKFEEQPSAWGVDLFMPYRDDLLAHLFPVAQTCPEIPVTEQVILSAQQWKDRVALQPAGSQDSVSLWAKVYSYVDTPGSPGLDCDRAFIRFGVSYWQARTDPDEVLPTWHVGLATMHKTLVANDGEERGVPHYHEAEFAIDRRTGKLVVVSKSADNMVTVSGNGVAQADDDGNQIDTHGLPGTFQSITTGRLKGNVVRFAADGQCPEA